jgi:hypothetical protein
MEKIEQKENLGDESQSMTDLEEQHKPELLRNVRNNEYSFNKSTVK